MQCPQCKQKNKSLSKYCIKCGWNFLTQSYDSDYCLKCHTPILHPEKLCPYCSNFNVNLKNKCELCDKYFHKSLFSSYVLTPKEKILLNIFEQKIFCPDCLEIQKIKAYSNLEDYKKKFSKIINEMPVLTINTPLNLTLLKYCTIVNSQSIIEKKYYEKESFFLKLENENQVCLNEIKKKALKSGANSIIGINISINEIDFAEKKLLISATGTGAVVEEFNILTEEEQQVFDIISDLI